MLVDSLLSIIDRLVELAQVRGKRRVNVFEKLVQPCFDELLAVHNDYIAMLEHAERLLSKAVLPEGSVASAKRLEEARAYLAKQRLSLEPVRQKLLALVRVIDSGESSVSQEAQEFLRDVGTYLCLGADVQIRPSTAATTLLERIQLDPGRSRVLVGELLSSLRVNWARVCEGFMRLKIQAAGQV